MTAGTAPRATVASPASGASRLRGDIEGLRAIAVLMVLAFHVGLPGAGGGFAGVDVFFVISGYLITSQLVREARRDGRVSLPRFYARRARRLLPAATLVLVVTTLAGWVLLPRGRHADLGTEVLAATGYVVNWLLAWREVDYLAEDQDPSLVQHYWSLSVEEQFYVVWPLLIIAVLWLVRRHRLRLLPTLTLALTVVVVASLTWSVVRTASSPGEAYFATTTRVWQLGVGALLVLLTSRLERLPQTVRAVLAVAGVAGIVLTLVAVDTGTPWPGTAAALPTLATAAVIAAGIHPDGTAVGRALGAAPLRLVGGLSYGLYLWHWPLLRLLAERVPESGLGLRLGVALLAAVLAWLTLHLVENPLRYSSALNRSARPALLAGAAAMGTSAALAGALVVSAPSLQLADGATTQGPVGALALVAPASRDTPDLELVDDLEAVTARVDQPVPDPAVADQDISLAYRAGCQVTTSGTELRSDDACTFGDPEGDTEVAVVGDSKMEQWSSALHAIGQQEGWRVRFYTKSACGFVAQGRSPECHDYNTMLAQRLGQPEHAPDLVLTSVGQGYPEELAGSMVDLLRPALDEGAEVVLVADTPLPEPRGVAEGVSSFECLDQHRDDIAPCWSPAAPASGTRVLTEVAARLDAPVVELLPWVCPAPDRLGGCAPVVGGVVVNRQGSHLTATYVRSLTPVLHHELARLGVATTPVEDIGWELPQDPATDR
ncbi:acyltransferase family protein [Serinicoccus sediminis]|uniref:acyltransferase family protein n=1 Tax=Serinicoccus sediminis TaxID=2306021 RepID=UPI001021F7E5|nr:acyltransferase family protein [Serinicoccus sediminis]